MTLLYFLLPVILGFAVLRSAGYLTRMRRLREYRTYATAFLDAEPTQRSQLLSSWMNQSEPLAVTWFLQGLTAMRSDQPGPAARAFGMAHHADPELTLAALLTFAGLKAAGGQPGDLTRAIQDTWHEMRSPNFTASAEDQLMLDTAERTSTPPPPCSKLQGMIWVMVGDAEQATLRQNLASVEQSM